MIIAGVFGIIYSNNVENDVDRVRCGLYQFFDNVI